MRVVIKAALLTTGLAVCPGGATHAVEEIPLPAKLTAEWDKVFSSDAELHGYLFALDVRCPSRFSRRDVSDYLDTVAILREVDFDAGYALGAEDYASPTGQAFCMKLVEAESMFQREGAIRRSEK